MEEFHASRARVRALIGGRGTGKTTTVAVEIVRHCFHNAGAKAYVLRKTQDSNQDTTLETFEHQVFPQMGTGYQDTGVSLFKKMDGGKSFRLPSRKAVEKYNEWLAQNPKASKADKLRWLEAVGNVFCSFMIFAGVPEERYRASRFRGFEASLLVLVEADQLSREDLDLGVACLRWKGTDPDTCDELGFIKDTGVILDTNPPSPRHWIAQMEEDCKDDPQVKFWHLATRDNSHNLPEGYVENLERQYKKNPAMLARMVYGQYAEAFDGTPVLYEFEAGHAGTDLPWPKGAYLVRGWDFGSTHSVTWSAYWYDGHDEYWWDLHEYFARQSDVDRQCKAVIEITNQVFPWWNDRTVCAGLKDYCDVAGNAKTDKGSSVQVLRTYGIFPGFQKMGLQESLAVYNRLLKKKDRFGRLIYRIDKTTCPMLYTASLGGYRYPSAGEPGFGGDEPLKGPQGGDYDHICFVGETLVDTEAGVRPISEVRVGDRVWTRKGLRTVIAAAMTSPDAEVFEYEFSMGAKFFATKEHPVFSCSYGYKPVSHFESNEQIFCRLNSKLMIARFVGPTGRARRAPVFNITVEDAHEYFAEGVLVSNCDASRYPKFNLLKLIKAEMAQEAKRPLGAFDHQPEPNRTKRYY